MAVAGTEQTSFNLGSRKITRQDGRLTLSDGTLAGADLDLTTAIGNMIQKVGVTIEDALHAATTRPAALIGRPVHGLVAGRTKISDVIRIRNDFQSVSALE
jgi:N-acetylglucosamine-6-phosphate deacetylase